MSDSSLNAIVYYQECGQSTAVPINLQNIQKDGSVNMSDATFHHKRSDMYLVTSLSDQVFL